MIGNSTDQMLMHPFTLRPERERILRSKLSNRLQGLSTDPCLTAFLDLFDRLDAEGLSQTVHALFSEIQRSGHDAGHLLEVITAAALLPVPAPRLLRCEQQEGLANVPGDIWMDLSGRRYEFQCKDSTNWTVELWMKAATDKIVSATKERQPGFYFMLTPTAVGLQADWDDFANWFVDNHQQFDLSESYNFFAHGRLVTKVSFIPASRKGVQDGGGSLPLGWQQVNLDLLRKKLGNSLQKGKPSLTALASDSQINCLVVDFTSSTLARDLMFEALYDHAPNVADSLCDQGISGVWKSGRFDHYSAIIHERAMQCAPFQVWMSVFPNPKYRDAVRDAFQNVPNFKVIDTPADGRAPA